MALRAEEEGVPKSCINMGHISEDWWGPPLVDAGWHAFCQANCKGFEGSGWEELYEYYKEFSKAAGVKKPNGSQRSKGPLENEGGKR